MSTTDDAYWVGLSPAEVGNALAAAGVLTALGLRSPRALARVIGRLRDRRGLRGAPLLEWRVPSQDLLGAYSAETLAVAWRQAVGQAVPVEGRPATARLWLHTTESDQAARQLGEATPPTNGVLVLSVAKPLGRSHPVPRWTWPLVIGVDLRAARTVELLVDQPRWLSDLVKFVDLRDPHQRCSLALLPAGWTETLVDPFGRARAAAAVVLGPDPGSPASEGMMDSGGLGAVAAVAFTGDDDPRLVVEIVRHLSHDLALDEAATMAARSRAIAGHRVYAEHAFLDRTRLRRMAGDRALERAPSRTDWSNDVPVWSARDFAGRYLDQPFGRETGDSTTMARDLDSMELATQRQERRFLRGEAVRQGSSAGRSAAASLRLRLWIGPSRRPGRDDTVPIDESTIEWDGDDVDLTVVLIPLVGRARPLRETLTLPRTGASTIVEFPVRASEAEPFRGRVAVLREHRFVQTAMVTVTVEGETTLAVESVVRPLSTDLLDVVPASVAIVHNHDTSGRPLVTTITEDIAWSVAPSELSGSISWFQEGLEAAADDPDQFGDPASPAFASVVVELAVQGQELNRLLLAGRTSAQIPEAAARRLVEAERVSVLSVVAGDVLPIEFIYDRELSTGPTKPGRLCPNAAAAARDGRCCATDDPSFADEQTVCPFGFWGMRKVIERHVNREEAARVRVQGGSQALAPSPTIDNAVATLRGVLGGASSRADLNPAEAWSAARERLSQRLGGNVRFADSWVDWEACLRKEAADVLLLLPHVGGRGRRAFLEIGQGDNLRLVHDLTPFIKGPPYPDDLLTRRPPIVLLLGCATAGGVPLDEFPSKFLDQGARLVIATLAVVRGRFVAPLGAELAMQILEQSRAGVVQVGELLRRLRLDAFVRGDPTAMALVAFGDSSWLLKAR